MVESSEIWMIIDFVLMTFAIAATVNVLNNPPRLPWLQVIISALVTMATWWYAPLLPIIFAFIALMLMWYLFFLVKTRQGWDRCIIAALIAFIIFIVLEIIVGSVFEALDRAVESALESATET